MDTRTGAWLIVRLELALGFGANALLGWFVISAPGMMGGPGPEPSPWAVALIVAGLAGDIVGLAWMWRIFRANPESGAPPWRYRDR